MLNGKTGISFEQENLPLVMFDSLVPGEDRRRQEFVSAKDPDALKKLLGDLLPVSVEVGVDGAAKPKKEKKGFFKKEKKAKKKD